MLPWSTGSGLSVLYCTSGTSQRELNPHPLESQGSQIREHKALWVKPASGPSVPSLEHRNQLCLAMSRK